MIEASRRKRAATRPVKRSPLFKDITGQKFGRVTVLEEIGNAEGSGRHILWKCICDCGKEITVDGTSIKSGNQLVKFILKNHPEDIQILCYNCNMARGHYGICPHQTKK